MFSSLAKHRRGRAKIKLTLKRGMDLPLFVGFWDCIQSGEEPLFKGINVPNESATHAAEILKSDESCISNPEIPKSQIGRVQFTFSGFRDLRFRIRLISKYPLLLPAPPIETPGSRAHSG